MQTLQQQPELENAAPPAESEKSPYRWLSYFVWQLVAILLVEAVLFSAGLGEEDTFKLDPQLGFTHMPGKRVTWRQEGVGACSYFDDDGMREPGLTIAKPAGTYRIALLGDSQVEAMQVPIEQTFGQLLAKRLAKEVGPNYQNVQVLNFGNSGYSTVQEYLQLKSKVFKYAPDLVILGYSSRDLLENWSPPDQAMTNVRPFAVHMPGRPLVIDNSPVTEWLKSPRAKFLNQISWIRQNSRIWGLISAEELNMSLSNPVYKTIVSFISKPGKTWRVLRDDAVSNLRANIQALRSQKLFPATATTPQSKLISQSISTTQSTQSQVKFPQPTAPVSTPHTVTSTLVTSTLNSAPNQHFVQLLTETMSALIAEMKLTCREHNASFCVMAMPSRSALCPAASDTTEKSYPQEVDIVRAICKTRNVPFLDSQSAAAELSDSQRRDLYYTAHLTPVGHQFVAQKLAPFIEKVIPGTTASSRQLSPITQP